MGQPAGRRGRQVLEDTLHRFHLQLLAICRLHLVEGSVGAYEYQRGSQDPEDSRASTGQPEEGERDATSQGILMCWAHLPAKEYKLRLQRAQIENVTGAKEDSQSHQQHGRCHHAVQDEAEKHEHVVALIILHVAYQALAKLSHIAGSRETLLVHEGAPGPALYPILQLV